MKQLAGRVFPCSLSRRASCEGQIWGLGTQEWATNSSGSGGLLSSVLILSSFRIIVFLVAISSALFISFIPSYVHSFIYPFMKHI